MRSARRCTSRLATIEEVTARLGERLREMVDALALAYPQQPRSGRGAWWVPSHLGGTAPSVEAAEALRERAARDAARG